jgi:hypothetical protein
MPFRIKVHDRPFPLKGDRTFNFGKLELGNRTPTLTPSMTYAKNIAFLKMDCLMRQYIEPLSLEIFPASLRQGEPAIRQAIDDRIVLK